MKAIACPFCKEEIRADSTVCRYCHQRVQRSKPELAMRAIAARLQAPGVVLPAVTECGALCQAKFAGNSQGLSQCLDDCKAAEAVAAVAERLQRELQLTFAEVVWGGGDIDPVPFERFVRERFGTRRAG